MPDSAGLGHVISAVNDRITGTFAQTCGAVHLACYRELPFVFALELPCSYKNGRVGGFVGERSGIADAEKFVADEAINFAADFCRIAIWVEFFGNVGALSPFPE